MTGWAGGLCLARALSRLILVGVDGTRRAHSVVRGVGRRQHALAGGAHGGSHAAGLAGLILVLTGGARGARLRKPVGGGKLAGWAVGAHRGRRQVQRRRKPAGRAILLDGARCQPVIGRGLVLTCWASAAVAHHRGIKVRDFLAGAALGLIDARRRCNINDKIRKTTGCGCANSKGRTDGDQLDAGGGDGVVWLWLWGGRGLAFVLAQAGVLGATFGAVVIAFGYEIYIWTRFCFYGLIYHAARVVDVMGAVAGYDTFRCRIYTGSVLVCRHAGRHVLTLGGIVDGVKPGHVGAHAAGDGLVGLGDLVLAAAHKLVRALVGVVRIPVHEAIA